MKLSFAILLNFAEIPQLILLFHPEGLGIFGFLLNILPNCFSVEMDLLIFSKAIQSVGKQELFSNIQKLNRLNFR